MIAARMVATMGATPLTMRMTSGTTNSSRRMTVYDSHAGRDFMRQV